MEYIAFSKPSQKTKRRATIIVRSIPDEHRIAINMAVCSPVDRFVKVEGVNKAMERNPRYKLCPEHFKDVEDFAKFVLNSLAKKFENNPSKYISRYCKTN